MTYESYITFTFFFAFLLRVIILANNDYQIQIASLI